MSTDRQRDRAMSLPRLGHVPALDGIRGLAVAVVVVHHLQVSGVHGGWLGVDLFFALSGLLITVSVVGLGEGTGLGAFWRRRAWRLGPAMAVLLAAYAVAWLATGADDEPGAVQGRWLLASAGQFLNIHDAGSRHGPFSDYLGHLWSLSAEVQFYVVWPILLTVLLRARAPRAVLLGAPAALLVGSSVLRTALAADGMQWNRLYLGPDTRSSALWAGCIVGLLVAWRTFDRSRVLRGAAAAAAVPALVVLAWIVSRPGMNFSLGTEPYRWGLTVIAVAAGLLVAAGAAARGGLLRRLLEAPPLEWLGRISYSVYLWHVPLIAELHRHAPGATTLQRVLVIVPASLLFGWASYAAVERPLLSAAGRARLRARLARRRAPVG